MDVPGGVVEQWEAGMGKARAQGGWRGERKVGMGGRERRVAAKRETCGVQDGNEKKDL